MLNNSSSISKKNLIRHPFHIINKSPWPFLLSGFIVHLPISMIWYFEYIKFSLLYVTLSIILVIIVITFWLSDVIAEGTYQGVYTRAVQRNLKTGFVLFILSEIMFFFAIFWTFFYFSLNPSIWIGAVWPPFGFIVIKWYCLPLLNTFILLSSGVTVTYAHRAASKGRFYKNHLIDGLILTIFLGFLFILVQFVEFNNCWFSINDSIYGSVFFFTTGFHGLHVIAGLIFLSVTLGRAVLSHFNYYPILGVEFSVWYWHFVDVIWIFVFSFVYVWGS